MDSMLPQKMDTSQVELPMPSSPGESRGRRRNREEGGDMMDGDNGDDGGEAGGSSRKRRRSRKGLDKKFECPHEGCGKSYSRAEHLYRHQLNRECPYFLPAASKQRGGEQCTLHDPLLGAGYVSETLASSFRASVWRTWLILVSQTIQSRSTTATFPSVTGPSCARIYVPATRRDIQREARSCCAKTRSCTISTLL
jgi:hypothetical protein